MRARSRLDPGASRSKTLNATAVRAEHRRLIARRLWSMGRTSRAQLSRETGLSRSTVSAVTDDLLRGNWVVELGAGSSRGGRRPVVLGFNDDARFAVGCDVGARHVSVALCNLSGAVKAWRHEPHAVRDDPRGTTALLNRLIRDVIAEEPDSRQRLLGIGVAMPSPVIAAEPNQLPAVILPKWVGHDLVGALTRAYDLPVVMDNDANVGALAELRWGAGRGRQHLIYIKLATGIGAGLVINGAIFHGQNGIAGEIAHVSIDASGPECVCGQRGCLVLLAGSGALIQRALATDPLSLAPDLDTGGLVDAALAGNEAARQTIEDAGTWVGIGIANLLNLIDPGTVILGGELTRAGRMLTEPIVKAVRERALSIATVPTQILISPLADRGVALGAATQLIDRAFERDDLFVPQETGAAPV
jgi:predicted NBD/HSP70 family sugar kinase